MKKHLSKFLLLCVLAIAIGPASEAQIIVRVKPVAPVLRPRPVAPGPRHIWVTGDYYYSGGQYLYKEGYWAVPPPRKTRWVDGRWRHRRGGWVWIPGHWR